MRSGCGIPAGGGGRSGSRRESPGIAELVSELPIVPLHAPNERRDDGGRRIRLVRQGLNLATMS